MARRPITDTLRDVRGGVLLDEASEKLQQLVLAVRERGKAGKLVIELEVRPFERASDAMVVRGEVHLKAPKVEPDDTVLFDTPEGNLSRKSPKQDDLPGIRLAEGKEKSA